MPPADCAVVHRDLKPEAQNCSLYSSWGNTLNSNDNLSRITRLTIRVLLFSFCCPLLSSFPGQNFLYKSTEEGAPLRVIDFGLSDYVKPGERQKLPENKVQTNCTSEETGGMTRYKTTFKPFFRLFFLCNAALCTELAFFQSHVSEPCRPTAERHCGVSVLHCP